MSDEAPTVEPPAVETSPPTEGATTEAPNTEASATEAPTPGSQDATEEAPTTEPSTTEAPPNDAAKTDPRAGDSTTAEATEGSDASATKDASNVQAAEGEAAPATDGEAAPATEGEPAPATEGEPTPATDSEAAPAKEGEPAPATDSEAAPVAEGEAADEGNMAPAAEGEEPSAAEGGAAPSTEGDAQPATEESPKKYKYNDVRNFLSDSMTESEVAELKRWRLDVEVRQELTGKERLESIKKAKEEDPECTFTPHILPRPPAEKDEEGGGVHERLATEAKYRVERKEKLKKKYANMAKADDEILQKDLTFTPKITPHPVQDGDDRKDPEKGPCMRMYEDFVHRENRWNTRWKKEGKPLPKKKAENTEPTPAMPEEEAISFAEEALTDLNTAWLLQNLFEVDDLARMLFDRARKSVGMTVQMTRRILNLILDAFQMSLNDLEFHSWFAALKNDEEEIDRKPFVFLVRSVLRTKLTTPLRTHSFGRTQSRMTPRGLRTPSKAKSPMKNSMRMCALADQPSEYATVLWTSPVPSLSVSLNRTSQTYKVEELHTIRGFHWHSQSITGVATPPVEIDPIMPQFVEPPAGATHYSFAHPPIHAAPMAQSLKRRKDPRMHFLIYGGFLLLGRDGTVLGVMALSPNKIGKDSYRFFLAPRHTLPDAVCEALMNSARLRPTTLAPFTEAPGWEQSLPSSTGDGVRSCWLTADAWYPISKFKWPKLPHGALAYVHSDGSGSYVPVMCYNQKCCGHRWEAMQGSVQALALPLVLRDVAAHIVQWSDIPELTRTAKGFSYYCHALYRDSLVDVDGHFARDRFEEIMSDLHKLCGIPEPYDEFMEATRESLSEPPDLESENAAEVEFILAMRHLLDCKAVLMEGRLAGHLGDTLKGLSGTMDPEPVPPNGMSLAWVIPEVPDLEIEVNVTERSYRVTRTDATGDDVWDWHLQGLLSEVQITDAESAGVDDEATIFAFAAPIPHLAKVLDMSRPSHAFLAYGGFVYMTNDYQVVHVRALSGKRITEDSTRLIFSAAVPCSLPLRFFPARRLHPTSVHLPHNNFEPTSHCAWYPLHPPLTSPPASRRIFSTKLGNFGSRRCPYY